MSQPQNAQPQQPEIPQPGAIYAQSGLQEEIMRLRAENGTLADQLVYFKAMYFESRDMVGSLLEQLSKDTPAPDETNQSE